MKSLLPCIAIFVFLAGWAAADLPKKAPISRYTSLWLNSPFTSKPPPVGPTEQANVFDEYALAGVSPIKGGYRVTLMNKKNPEERTTIDTDDPNSKFKVVSVNRKAGDALGTTVRITSGSQTGTVSYDEKLLTIAAPKVAPHPPGAPQIPGQPVPAQPGQQPIRQPRPRVVPPPPSAGQVQQPRQGQPVQHNSQRNFQRPERRRN